MALVRKFFPAAYSAAVPEGGKSSVTSTRDASAIFLR